MRNNFFFFQNYFKNLKNRKFNESKSKIRILRTDILQTELGASEPFRTLSEDCNCNSSFELLI